MQSFLVTYQAKTNFSLCLYCLSRILGIRLLDYWTEHNGVAQKKSHWSASLLFCLLLRYISYISLVSLEVRSYFRSSEWSGLNSLWQHRLYWSSSLQSSSVCIKILCCYDNHFQVLTSVLWLQHDKFPLSEDIQLVRLLHLPRWCSTISTSASVTLSQSHY